MAQKQPDLLDIAKRRGFFWQSGEIYGGLSGFYDYGPLGTLLKLRIEDLIRSFYINKEGCLVLDSALVSSEEPWVASGHIKKFADMTADCMKCGEPYRADHLVGEKLKIITEGMSLNEVYKHIREKGIKCPKCGGTLGDVYQYNLMFSTEIGPGKRRLAGKLRPETAQGTYVSFRRLFELARKTMPFGVIQVGKAFRNEISPRQGLIRLREFSQAEVQFFMSPEQKKTHPRIKEIEGFGLTVVTKDGKKKEVKGRDLSKLAGQWIAYHLVKALQLFESMGIPRNNLLCRQHLDTERAFYSRDTWDIEFISEDYGKIELVGIADRGDYDLTRHQEMSKQNMGVTIDGKTFIPHVIEVAYGIDRPLFVAMISTLKQDKDRVYFGFSPGISPYQVAVLPLVKKDDLPERAEEIYNMLLGEGFYALYDEGFIGRLYYRQDEAGTPFCVTIDYDTLKGKGVTIRHRDNQRQIRVGIEELGSILRGLFVGKIKFESAGNVVK